MSVRTGSLKRWLDLQSSRVLGYIEWLEQKGYIRDLQHPRRGEVEFITRIPSTWNWDAPDEAGEGLSTPPDEPSLSEMGGFR